LTAHSIRDITEIVICIRDGGSTFKLAWLHEDQKGVYSGLFGKGKGTHFSYHADGQIHAKSQRKKLLPVRDVPIADIKGIKQIPWTTGIPFGSLDRVSDSFAKNNKVIHLFISDPSNFSNYTHLGINQFLLDNSIDDASFETYCRMFSRVAGTLLGFLTRPLHHFPKHKLAVVVTASNHPRTSAE
jgi:hypothetical protein